MGWVMEGRNGKGGEEMGIWGCWEGMDAELYVRVWTSEGLSDQLGDRKSVV